MSIEELNQKEVHQIFSQEIKKSTYDDLDILQDRTILNDVLIEFPTDILSIICEYGVLTQSDIVEKLQKAIDQNTARTNICIRLKNEFEWRLIYQVTERNTSREICTLDIGILTVHIRYQFRFRQIRFIRQDYKNHIIRILREAVYTEYQAQFVPIVAHLLCLWAACVKHIES